MGDLITDEYREMQRKLHENPDYGVASVGYAPLVAELIHSVGATELLDYGAGKGRLGQTLSTLIQSPLTIRHYDPAIPQWSKAPQPCPMVACIDVLEHIEPSLIDNVLDDLKRVTLRHGVFTVHTQPAVKVLPDGRNAHLIQKPPAWWLPKFMERFELLSFNAMPMGFWVFVEREEADPARQGAMAGSGLDMLCNVIDNLGVTEVVEFGGNGLGAKLNARLQQPVAVRPHVEGNEEKSSAALVACIDHLHGLEPAGAADALERLKRVGAKYAVVTIRERSAGGGAAVDAPAPTTRQSAGWWLERLLERFDVICYNRLPEGFGAVMERKAS